MSVIDHISVQVNDLQASMDFYDAVLAPLGAKRLMQFGATGPSVTLSA